MPKLLKQAELRDIVEKRDLVRGMERDLKNAKEDLDKLELLAIHAVETGYAVEKGTLTPAIDTVAGRRSPKWKEEFAAVAGPAAVEAVVARTEPGPAAKKLVIVVGRNVAKAS